VDVAITTVHIVAPSLHHRDPLSETYLILPSSYLRSTGNCRFHPMLDALGLDEADDLELQRPNQNLPLAKSTNRLRPDTSLTTALPSRRAPTRSLSMLGFLPAASIVTKKTMPSRRSSFRSGGWRRPYRFGSRGRCRCQNGPARCGFAQHR
jgi:hypothetical protein